MLKAQFKPVFCGTQHLYFVVPREVAVGLSLQISKPRFRIKSWLYVPNFSDFHIFYWSLLLFMKFFLLYPQISGLVFCSTFFFFFEILKIKFLPTWRYLIVMTNWEEFFSWFTLPKHKGFNLVNFSSIVFEVNKTVLFFNLKRTKQQHLTNN